MSSPHHPIAAPAVVPLPHGAASGDADAQAAGDAVARLADPAAVGNAHAAILGDKSIQFTLPHDIPKQNPPPAWLRSTVEAIQSVIEWIGPAWPYILWTIAGLVVLALVFAIFAPAREWLMTLIGRPRRGKAEAEAQGWTPEAGAARALLDEADRLAADGNYAEAVHLILYRSIEDIERWRGDIVRPSLTSRDIARADALPATARSVFARIVAAVEASLFGGRPLGADDWGRARADYAAFALRGR